MLDKLSSDPGCRVELLPGLATVFGIEAFVFRIEAFAFGIEALAFASFAFP